MDVVFIIRVEDKDILNLYFFVVILGVFWVFIGSCFLGLFMFLRVSFRLVVCRLLVGFWGWGWEDVKKENESLCFLDC